MVNGHLLGMRGMTMYWSHEGVSIWQRSSQGDRWGHPSVTQHTAGRGRTRRSWSSTSRPQTDQSTQTGHRLSAQTICSCLLGCPIFHEILKSELCTPASHSLSSWCIWTDFQSFLAFNSLSARPPKFRSKFGVTHIAALQSPRCYSAYISGLCE